MCLTGLHPVKRTQPTSSECFVRYPVFAIMVPQGFVLGPALFTMYTKPLDTTAQQYGIKYHSYADDTQLYVSLHPVNEVDFPSS